LQVICEIGYIVNMQKLPAKTWKEKIDPGFDSMIKNHVGLLENLDGFLFKVHIIYI